MNTMKSNTGLQSVIGRELERIKAKPTYMVLAIFLPLLSILLFSAILSEEVPRDIPVTVLDRDHSHLSRKIIRMIDASPSISISKQVSNIEEGHKSIRDGSAYSFIMIPEGLERKVLRHDATEIVSYNNNVYQIPAALVGASMQSIVTTTSIGLKVKYRLSKGETTKEALVHAHPIKVDSHYLFNPYKNYLYYLETALLPVMLQIFILITTIYAFGSELKEKTYDKWQSTASHAFKAYIGKAIPYTVIFSILGIFINIWLFKFQGAPLRGSFFVISVAMIFFVIAYQALGITFVMITKDLGQALNMGAGFAVPVLALAGFTFPGVGIPKPAVILGKFFPFSHYLEISLAQGMRGMDLWYVLPSFGYLLMFCLLPITYSIISNIRSFPKEILDIDSWYVRPRYSYILLFCLLPLAYGIFIKFKM